MPGQWPDCSDKRRARVPHINLAINDMVNPCELAKEFEVPLSQLRAFQVRDPVSGKMMNDFAVARNRRAPRLVARRGS
jgi:hypothetical protein